MNIIEYLTQVGANVQIRSAHEGVFNSNEDCVSDFVGVRVIIQNSDGSTCRIARREEGKFVEDIELNRIEELEYPVYENHVAGSVERTMKLWFKGNTDITMYINGCLFEVRQEDFDFELESEKFVAMEVM